MRWEDYIEECPDVMMGKPLEIPNSLYWYGDESFSGPSNGIFWKSIFFNRLPRAWSLPTFDTNYL